MLVLGIDPGSVKTGWSLLEKKGSKVIYIDSGVLNFNSKTPFMERLIEIKAAIKDVLKNAKPIEVAFESLIYVKSPTALMKLAQTRGVIISECLNNSDIKIFEYSPNLVKSVITGHGHASKESVQKFIKLTLGVTHFQSDDESDAIAIALCHIFNTKGVSATQNQSRRGSMKASLAHKIGEL